MVCPVRSYDLPSMAHTIVNTGEIRYEVNRSRFIGLAYPVRSRGEVEKILSHLREEYSDATHIVYAFRLGETGADEYFTDAGEPSGTAGAPIMKFLQSKELTNILVAVVRYFGGIKLGTGGLVRAYGKAASMAVEQAGIVPFVKMVDVRFEIPYGGLTQLHNFLSRVGGTVLEQDFGGKVKLSVRIPEGKLGELSDFVAQVSRSAPNIEVVGEK